MIALFLAVALQAPLVVAQSDEAKAKVLYKEGETAYNLGQFDQALAKYSDAYKLKALPGFLFNMAQCHRQLGNYERAAFFFGRFIDTSPPKAPNVDVAKGLLAEMKQREGERKNAEAAKAADEEQKRIASERARDELKQPAPEPQPTVIPPPVDVRPLPPLTPPPAPPAVVEEAPPVYKRGWFWGVVVAGAVVVAAGVTVGVVLGSPKPPTPTLMPDLR